MFSENEKGLDTDKPTISLGVEEGEGGEEEEEGGAQQLIYIRGVLKSTEISSVDLQAVAQFLPLIFLSIVAWWKENVVLFMLVAAVAVMTGLYSPDIISGTDSTSPLGLSIGLALIIYHFGIALSQ